MSNEANKRGRPRLPNRQGLYAQTAKHAEAAIGVLVTLMSSRNENIRLGAARTLLDKCLPDLKAVDLKTEEDKQPIQVTVVSENGFLPPGVTRHYPPSS